MVGTMQAARDAFNEIDTDASGYLDRTEVAAMAATLGVRPKRRELDAVMHIMNPSGSGRVSAEDFQSWWKFRDTCSTRKTKRITAGTATQE